VWAAIGTCGGHEDGTVLVAGNARIPCHCAAALTAYRRLAAIRERAVGSMAPAYGTASAASADGTVMGYRRLGRGLGVVLCHGSLGGSQGLMKLAAALADAFAVYVPGRWGRH
jgi:hypothetical protein